MQLKMPDAFELMLCYQTPRAFSVVGPSVWNSLPDYLRISGVGRDKFRHHLKTFMFASY